MDRSLRVDGVSKRYGAVQALSLVSCTFVPGKIHAVLGENGAGKSTLVSILSGFVVPDEGSVTLGTIVMPLGKAFECKRLGVEMIHQHFTLVQEFTVAENLALANLPKLATPIRVDALAKSGLEAAANLDWKIDASAKVSSLPVGAQQRLEILKAVRSHADVLIFDEPTAVLAPEEVGDLFRVLRTFREQGKIVILIAHKLSEVLAIADEVTVLRRGKVVGGGPLSNFGEESLATLMVGDLPRTLERAEARPTETGLEARGLTVLADRGDTAVRAVNFDVHRGEILGIGGVDGNGQVELAEVLAGVRPIQSGTLHWKGRAIDFEELAPGYVPQDRQSDGLALGMSILDNLLISGYRRPSLGSGPWLSQSRSRVWARDLIGRYGIKTQGPDQTARSLSGGNQQKVVVSRALDGDPELLVAVNPTRGLDLKATEYVHDVLRQACQRGAAIALFTTDLDELASLSDRTLFMSRGELREGGAVALVGGT